MEQTEKVVDQMRRSLTFIDGYGTAVPTIGLLLKDLSPVDTIAREVALRLEREHQKLAIAFVDKGWEVAFQGDDPLKRNYIVIARATRIPRVEPAGINPSSPEAVFLKWCPGTSEGRGKFVYFTVSRWNRQGGKEANPLPGTARHYRDWFLGLGLPVHVASFHGLERDREQCLGEFLNLNAVVYDPDGELAGRTANQHDFDEEGVLVEVSDTIRLYKGE